MSSVEESHNIRALYNMKLPPGYVPGQGVHKATAYGGFGEKLMKQMGWQEGHGLGRDQKGMKKAIEVKHKEDNIGVCLPIIVVCFYINHYSCILHAVGCLRFLIYCSNFMQVDGKAGFAWERKWWEEAYDSKAKKIQVSPLVSCTFSCLVSRQSILGPWLLARLEPAVEVEKGMTCNLWGCSKLLKEER